MSARVRLAGLVDNPLIVKDGVSRMRSWRAPVVLTVYLGLLGVFGYAIFVLYTVMGPSQRIGSAMVGSSVFTALAFIQISLISLFAPALAAGAISGERERQTLDVLLVSRVTALGIVWGKLVASVAFMLLLILAALPLFAAVFLFGGIDFEQFLVTQVLTLSTAVSIGAVSLLLSAVFRRTLPSTVTAYGAAFAGVVGTLAAGWLLTLVIWQRQGVFGSTTDVHPLLFVNPIYALQIVLSAPNGAPMHLGRLVALLFLITDRGNGAGPQLEPWQGTLLLQVGLIAASIVGAVRLVGGRVPTTPRRRPEEAGEEGEMEVDEP